jgi:hypothetical protein
MHILICLDWSIYSHKVSADPQCHYISVNGGGSKRCDINQNVSKAGKNNKSDIQRYCLYILFIFHINTFNNYGIEMYILI